MDRDDRGDAPDAAEPLASGAARGAASGLMRSSAVVGAGTLLSRVTGLLRTMVTASVLGAAVLANAYNLANTTPNIIYDLVLGGVLSATLVPVFVDLLGVDDDQSQSAVVTGAIVLLVAVSVAVAVFAPVIFGVYTSLTSADQADALAVAGVPLLRMFAPQILFYGLTALAAALLNTRGRFAAAAFAPVLNNLVVIGAMVAFGVWVGSRLDPSSVVAHGGQLWLLGMGTTAGIVLQAVVLWPVMRRAGVRLRWRFDLSDPAVRRVASLSKWTFGYVVNNVVALMIVLVLATRVGGVSAYTYAYVFFQLPYGLFAVSLMTTFTPRLAADVSAGDLVAFRSSFGSGLRALVLTILPASVGLAIVARPLVGGLLQFRNFTESDGATTAGALAAFCAGLLGYSVYPFTLRGFYAFKDTRTPYFTNLGQNALNVVLGVALLDRLGTEGLALAFGVSYVVAAVAALVLLARRAGGLVDAALARWLLRAGVATAAMAAVALVAVRTVGTDTGAGAVLRVAVTVAAGAIAYGLVLLALRVPEATDLLSRLRRRRV